MIVDDVLALIREPVEAVKDRDEAMQAAIRAVNEKYYQVTGLLDDKDKALRAQLLPIVHSKLTKPCSSISLSSDGVTAQWVERYLKDGEPHVHSYGQFLSWSELGLTEASNG